MTPFLVILPGTLDETRSDGLTETSSRRTWYWFGPSMCSLKTSIAILTSPGWATQLIGNTGVDETG